MRKKIISIVALITLSLIVTFYNTDTFLDNIISMAALFLAISLLVLLNSKGTYDSVYFSFGKMRNRSSQDKERRERYESFANYKNYIKDIRPKRGYFLVLFYFLVVVLGLLLRTQIL